MKFQDFIGQDIIIQSLINSNKWDKIANAYIFNGANGSGRKTLASLFAMIINCKNSKVEPCGVCSSCIKIQTNNHPDIKIVRPTGSTIKIKQIWDITKEVSKKSNESEYKVIIIEDADAMTTDAQNAFLKTLEEPVSSTVFILITNNYNSLLSTIVSRCVVYNLKRVSKDKIREFLINKFKDDKKAAFAANSCEGLIGAAIKIIENENYNKKREIYINIVNELKRGKYHEINAISDSISENRADAMIFLEFILTWFRDLLLFCELLDEAKEYISNIDKWDEIQSIAFSLTFFELNSIIEIIMNTVEQIEHNVSVRNSIDCMFLNIMEVFDGKGSWSEV